MKVAGVRAGAIESFAVDEDSYRALVEISISKKGFGDLREDVFCEARPQSLIGEYFLDCHPGESTEKLPRGARIPVEQTASTIPIDLINNIYRRPYRERFSIIFAELGAALAARGEDLNETIRRANPALRETNKVLAALREQRHVIRDLTDDAEDVVVALAANKSDVGRFVEEARDTAQASAERYDGLREQWQRFPGFLRELRPTMAALGEAVDRQRPALANLSEQAPLLERFLDDLGPFAEASRPAFRTLAAAARKGRPAVAASLPRIEELEAFAALLPETVTNLAITLEHLHDREFAVEENPLSPGGAGFTGWEAILQYIFRQSQATNVYDGNSYLLKVSAFLDNNCAQYADAAAARDPAKQYCRAILGPNQPGIDQPAAAEKTRAKAPAKKRSTKKRRERDRSPERAADESPREGEAQAPKPAPVPELGLPGPVQQLLDDLVAGGGALPQGGVEEQLPLLDFLLGS